MNDSIKLLNLKEEEIDIITSHIENNVMYINLTLRRKDEECPNCKSILNKVESYRNKQINHPMLNSMKCIVNYRCRRLRCITCNKTFNESNTFVKKSKHATDYEVFNVLNLLKSPHITFTDVAKQCNISVTKVQYILINMLILQEENSQEYYQLMNITIQQLELENMIVYGWILKRMKL